MRGAATLGSKRNSSWPAMSTPATWPSRSCSTTWSYWAFQDSSVPGRIATLGSSAGRSPKWLVVTIARNRTSTWPGASLPWAISSSIARSTRSRWNRSPIFLPLLDGSV
jgi:hypothetical protein